MTWNHRYCSHLGYRSPDAPLFGHSVGSLDMQAHVAFAAELGFAGVQHAWIGTRSLDEQNTFGRALAKHGLAAGCVVYAPREEMVKPTWARRDAESRATINGAIENALDVARRVGSRHVVVLGGADGAQPRGLQLAALIDNLRDVGDSAAKAGVTLVLEPISAKSVPNMLLHHFADGVMVARAVNHPAVKLIYDTSHMQVMDGDLLANMEAGWDQIALVQIADNPGRLEPGSGEINFASILHALKQRGYAGLVELEHGWSAPTRECEARGIEYLRKLDAGLR